MHETDVGNKTRFTTRLVMKSELHKLFKINKYESELESEISFNAQAVVIFFTIYNNPMGMDYGA